MSFLKFAQGRDGEQGPFQKVGAIILDENGSATVSSASPYKVSISDGSNIADVDGLGSLKVFETTTLVGASFEGNILDNNFWTDTTGNGATVTQGNGLIKLETNTTANGSAQVQSVRYARKIPGTVNQMRIIGQLNTTAEPDNVRTIGVYDDDNGAFFKIDGTTLKVVKRKGGTDTEVSNGSFNGDVSSASIDTNFHRGVIEYTALNAKFWYDGVLLHTFSSTTEPWTESLTLPIRAQNYNTGGNTTDNKWYLSLLTTVRLGQLETETTSDYQSGQIPSKVLKYGAGELKRAIISGVQNNSVITLYDNTTATTNTIWSSGAMGAQTQPYSLDFGELQFGTGLSLSITGADSNITITYE